MCHTPDLLQHLQRWGTIEAVRRAGIDVLHCSCNSPSHPRTPVKRRWDRLLRLGGCPPDSTSLHTWHPDTFRAFLPAGPCPVRSPRAPPAPPLTAGSLQGKLVVVRGTGRRFRRLAGEGGGSPRLGPIKASETQTFTPSDAPELPPHPQPDHAENKAGG